MNKKLVDETAEESFQTEASEQVEKLQFEKAPTALTWEPTSLSNDVGRKKKNYSSWFELNCCWGMLRMLL